MASHDENVKEQMENDQTKNENNESEGETTSTMTKTEYFNALEKWVQQTKMMQSLSVCFPYYLMANYPQAFSTQPSFPTASTQSVPPTQYLNNNYTAVWPGLLRQRPQTQAPPAGNDETRRPPAADRGENSTDAEIILRHGGVEYVIPPLWKRFIAEFIDFLILFFIKLAVTFVAVDFFNLVDLDKFDLDTIRKNIQEDYKVALEMTTEILLLECFHRVSVCAFETVWLQGGIGGRIGAATPGKAVMGLRVIMATAIVPIPGRAKETVLVYPGSNLGLPLAFGRALVKNLLLAMLFPICFVLFFFQFNRTCYDMLCHSLVVEDNPNPVRRRAP